MISLTFEVHGSKGDVYEIRAGSKTAGNVWMTCTCQAGRNGIYCRHRFALIDGDVTRLASPNADDVKTLQALIAGSDIDHGLRHVTHWQAIFDHAKAELTAAKRTLARAMLD